MSACSYMVRPEACFSPPQMCAHTRGYRKTHANSGVSVTSPDAYISVCFNRCLLYLTSEKRKSIASSTHSLFAEVVAGAGGIFVKLLFSLLTPHTDLKDVAWHVLIIQSAHPLQSAN